MNRIVNAPDRSEASPQTRYYQPFDADKAGASKQQRKELERWSDEGGSQTEIVNPDPDSDSSARNGSGESSSRQSQVQSSKSHKSTA